MRYTLSCYQSSAGVNWTRNLLRIPTQICFAQAVGVATELL